MIYPNGGLPEKFQRRRKQFVEVVAEHKLDGTTLPKTIIRQTAGILKLKFTENHSGWSFAEKTVR